MEVLDHCPVVLLRFLVLLREDAGGLPRISGEEEGQIFLQLVEGRLRQPERDDLDAIGARRDGEAIDAAEGGDVLVLLADGPLQLIDLEAACLLGQLAIGHVAPGVAVQSLEQRHRERA